MNFVCPECGHVHDMSGTIEEAQQNGYPVGEVEEMCGGCGTVVTFERDVEEL